MENYLDLSYPIAHRYKVDLNLIDFQGKLFYYLLQNMLL